MEALDAPKGGARGNAVNKDKTLAVSDPLVSKRCVLLLAGCVENLEHTWLPVDNDLLAIRVLDCRIILIEAQLLAKALCSR